MKLSPLESEALGLFRARLGSRFGARLESVTLFGSRARGEGHEASDLDVLVRVRALTPAERRAVIDEAYTIELSHGARIEPLVRDADGAALGGMLALALAQDGVPL